ncbi:GNAT family N-acetyltransferase [Actinomyces timonensis]|uniref:GNAT family N-acetyltransferase n=1 Tax=Actinomyces timonensis TaxID=1288391 RepID=A0AAU8N648_9ACTO
MPLFTRRLTPVSPRRVGGVLALCSRDPVLSLPLAQQLERWRHWGSGDVVVLGRPAAPDAAAWSTGSLIVVGLAPRPELGLPGAGRVGVRALAEHARPRLTRNGSILGSPEDVSLLWAGLEAAGMRCREARWNQPVLIAPSPPGGLAAQAVARRPSSGWAARGTRQARPEEESLVLPASVAMFTEEVGYDPMSSGGSYARHVSWLVGEGRSDVLLDDGQGRPARPWGPARVAFKVDVGGIWHAPGGAVAQLTGVWTRPDLRGRGVASAALAAAVDAVRHEHVGPDGGVSLYVNDFNAPARALYRSLGFTQHGAFATVLL